MDLLESSSHSFVVKIWLERSADEAGGILWRGRITHVPDGELNYFEELDAIALFIAPYLSAMGVPLPPSVRVKRWLKRWRLSWKNP